MAKTVEQRARDLLERMEVPGAQDYTAGEIVELANLLNGVTGMCCGCLHWDVSCYECNHPDNLKNCDIRSPEYRSIRRCGPKFGCIYFTNKQRSKV